MGDVTQILTAFYSAIKNQSTGILKVQSATSNRQFIFSKGICLDIGSNLKEELPGTFLFQQKILDDHQYQSYLQKCSAPKTNQWLLANTEAHLQPSDLFDKRRMHAKIIIKNIQPSQITNVQFQTLPNLPAGEPIIETMDVFLSLAAKFTSEQIKDYKKEFLDPTTRVTVIREPDKTELDEDQGGLFTVIQHNATLSEILDSSFLDKEKIFQWLLAFEMTGFIRCESSSESEKRRFFDSLTELQKKNRELLKKELQRVTHGNFYETLELESDADVRDIDQALQKLTQKFSHESFNNLFYKGEEILPVVILEKIRYAHSVLSNGEKKKEYDSFVGKGSNQNFLDQSQTLLEEKLLSELNQLVTERKFDEAIAFIGKNVTEHPEFIKLYSTLVDLVRGLKMNSEELNQKIFAWFKIGISKNPQEGQLFLLLGEWCLSLSQQSNALKAFQKALHIRAGSSKIRNYILQIDPKEGRQIIVESVYQSLEGLNHFEMLGLEPIATEKEIRDSYREISKHLHPDRFFNSNNQSLKEMAKRVFKEMVASYMVLKEDQKRKDYLDHLFSSKRKKEEKQKTTLPKSIQARKYYDQAVLFIEDQNLSSAKLNLQLALSYEPDNLLVQKMLKEIKDKLSNTIV